MLVGLDFDGTLVPFAERPEQVRLDEQSRRLLETLRDRGFQVAVVSGRAMEDLISRVGVEGIAYAGNYGAELRLPEGGRMETRMDDHARALCALARTSLENVAAGLQGVWVEDKGPVLALHFRQADIATRLRMRGRLDAWKERRPPGLREREGHDVIEYLLDWLPTKGDALLDLARAFNVPSAEGIVYIGDDETDEEVFRALGPLATTARVGPSDLSSAARYRLEGPDEVRELLAALSLEAPRSEGRG